MSTDNAHLYVSEQMQIFLRTLTLSPDASVQEIAMARLSEERRKAAELRAKAESRQPEVATAAA